VPPVSAPSLPGPVLLQQTWRNMVYVHWPVAPESVARLFPAGTRPDTLEGRTYIGVVGLTMPSTRLGGALGIGPMHELNVRLYSVDGAGRQGVVFLSMDVSRPDVVLAARLVLGLPYLWSRLRPVRPAPAVAGFHLRRRLPPRLVANVEIEIGEPLAQPSALEVFLTARWGLQTRTLRGTAWVPIAHAALPLHRARLRNVDDALLLAAGLPALREEPLGVLWSPGLEAAIGHPVR
jgi:uncharacterized protein